MGWKFPRRLPRTDQVVDYRDFNDGLMPFAEEDGKLNEHNWSDDLQTQLTRATDLDDDISFRVGHVYTVEDASENYNGSPEFVEADVGWTLVPDMTYEFSTRGGSVYVICSLQFGAGNLQTTALVYTRFAIRLDGAILPISLVGDQDFYSSGATMEIGLSGRMQGVDIDHSFPVAAGKHTVEIMVDVRSVNKTDGDLRTALYTRELLVWEIR